MAPLGWWGPWKPWSFLYWSWQGQRLTFRILGMTSAGRPGTQTVCGLNRTNSRGGKGRKNFFRLYGLLDWKGKIWTLTKFFSMRRNKNRYLSFLPVHLLPIYTYISSTSLILDRRSYNLTQVFWDRAFYPNTVSSCYEGVTVFALKNIQEVVFRQNRDHCKTRLRAKPWMNLCTQYVKGLSNCWLVQKFVTTWQEKGPSFGFLLKWKEIMTAVCPWKMVRESSKCKAS